jgi:predicted Zn-dependent protease
LQEFARDSFSGLGLLEERSFLSGRLGESVFDARVSISDDALDPHGLPKAFDTEGTPKRPLPLVEEGVARGVVWDRLTAARAGGGQQSTGHAAPPDAFVPGPAPRALSLGSGDAESVGDLVEVVGDGVYVTRLHYLSVADPRAGVITGMTRDGTFRIRGGMLAEPLVNLRFTVSVPEVLAEVPGLTRGRTLVNQSVFYAERYPFGALVPALATAWFNVTGNGAAPGI